MDDQQSRAFRAKEQTKSRDTPAGEIRATRGNEGEGLPASHKEIEMFLGQEVADTEGGIITWNPCC